MIIIIPGTILLLPIIPDRSLLCGLHLELCHDGCRTQSKVTHYHVRAVYLYPTSHHTLRNTVERGVPIDCIRQILFLKECFRSVFIDDFAKIHTYS